MDKELRQEVKNLIKLGFPENIAIITACANQKKSEFATEYLNEIIDENEEVEMLVKYLIPMSESIRLQQEEEARIIYSKPLEIEDKNEILTKASDVLPNEVSNNYMSADHVDDGITITENSSYFPLSEIKEELGITESLHRC